MKLYDNKKWHSLHQEDIAIINIYAANIGALKYGKPSLIGLKGEIATH